MSFRLTVKFWGVVTFLDFMTADVTGVTSVVTFGVLYLEPRVTWGDREREGGIGNKDFWGDVIYG